MPLPLRVRLPLSVSCDSTLSCPDVSLIVAPALKVVGRLYVFIHSWERLPKVSELPCR